MDFYLTVFPLKRKRVMEKKNLTPNPDAYEECLCYNILFPWSKVEWTAVSGSKLNQLNFLFSELEKGNGIPVPVKAGFLKRKSKNWRA